MPAYHFCLRNDVGDNEELGYFAMADDDAALDFGRDVIRDISRQHAAAYTGSGMEITEGARVVGIVPFGSTTHGMQKNYG